MNAQGNPLQPLQQGPAPAAAQALQGPVPAARHVAAAPARGRQAPDRGQQQRVRAITFTGNGFANRAEVTDKCEALHQKCTNREVKYMVVGAEIGANGNHHVQGYIVFVNAKTLQAAKTWIGNNPHVEAARGTPTQCSNYCKKGEQPHLEWTQQNVDGPNFGLNAHYLEFGELPLTRQDASARGNHPMLIWMRTAPIELFPSCTLTAN